MDIYLVFGFISEDGSDEGHTYIYGVFDNRVVAEEKKNKLEEALERDGSDERIYIKYLKMFDDFDIDYNAMKYLIETRCSGALTTPYSAMAIEWAA